MVSLERTVEGECLGWRWLLYSMFLEDASSVHEDPLDQREREEYQVRARECVRLRECSPRFPYSLTSSLAGPRGYEGSRGTSGAAGEDGLPGRQGPQVRTFCQIFLRFFTKPA